MHPGASVPARAWAPERNAALVAALAAQGAARASSPARPPSARSRRSSPGDAGEDLGGATDLGGLADVLAAADCVVVGNTGPAHLAAAVGTPVVSLYAPTVPAARWRPWRVPHVLLHDRSRARAAARASARCRATRASAASRVGDVVAAVGRLAPRRAEVAAA